MSTNNLELSKGINNVYLNFWDSLHGKDRIFVLEKNGKFEQIEDEVNGGYVNKPIVLRDELRAMANSF